MYSIVIIIIKKEKKERKKKRRKKTIEIINIQKYIIKKNGKV